MSLLEAFIPSTAQKAEDWIKQMRRKHIPNARPLRPEELAALDRHFEGDTLDLVRVEEVRQMERSRTS